MTISDYQLQAESLPLWFIWEKKTKKKLAVVEDWSLDATSETGGQTEGESWRVRPLQIFLSTVASHPVVCGDRSPGLTLFTSDQSQSHGRDIKEDTWKDDERLENSFDLYLSREGLLSTLESYFETLCFTFVWPSLPPESPWIRTLSEWFHWRRREWRSTESPTFSIIWLKTIIFVQSKAMYWSVFIRRAPYSCLSLGFSQVYFLSQRVFSVVPPCCAVIIEFYCAAGELL